MSTAAVATPTLPPNPILDESTAAAFGGATKFISNTPIDQNGTPTTSSPTGGVANDKVFVLGDGPFIDLQAYLVLALRLPATKDAFELTYPKDIFKPRLDKGDATLYDRTRSTMNDIYTHCSDFKKNTLNMMISTAGLIANFSDQAATQSAIALKALPILSAAGANVNDPAVAQAGGDFADAITVLKISAKKASEDCATRVKEIGAFKDLTSADKSKLQGVHTDNMKYLPSVEDLNTENKAAMAAAYEVLNKICKEQNKKYDQLKGAISVFGWVPLLNVALSIGNIKNEFSAIDGIRRATSQYQAVFDKTNTEMKTALIFRAQSQRMMDSMNAILGTIGKVEDALITLTGVFSTLQTDLSAIEDNLEASLGKASGSNFAGRRAKAAQDLNAAGAKWAVVVDLAKCFQEKGIKTVTSIDQALPGENTPIDKIMQINSTNYGGVDVSEFSQVLFRFGDAVRIRSIEPGFPDPWDRVPKTISMIHTYDKSLRLFICKEFTGFHVLNPGPVSGYQGAPNVKVELNTTSTKKTGATVEVLAICWGPEVVTAKAGVLDYIYSTRQSNQAITFSNDKMGGDTWWGYRKTGVVFYRVAGGTAIWQITGREGESINWPDN